MKSEVLYKLQLSWPGNLDSGFQRCRNVPDRVELSDRLGYCYDWEVEPHIFDKYPHTSASDVVGAGAQRDICKSFELCAMSCPIYIETSRRTKSGWLGHYPARSNPKSMKIEASKERSGAKAPIIQPV